MINLVEAMLSTLEKRKYIIYGTGNIAGQCYDYIINKFGKEYVAYFLTSWEISKNETRYGVKTLTLSDLSNIDKEKYYYICTSKASGFVMQKNLIKKGIPEGQIIRMADYFYPTMILKEDKTITKIAFWPKAPSDKVQELVKKIDWFLPVDAFERIDIYTDETSNLREPPVFFRTEDTLYDEYDVILVWKEEALLDRILLNQKAYCIDTSNGRPKAELKTLASISYVTKYAKAQRENVIQRSKRLWQELLGIADRKGRAVFMATGPSLTDYVQNNPDLSEHALTITCNTYDKTTVSQTLIPDAYCVCDIIFLIQYESWKNTMDYIRSHNCILFLPYQYVEYVVRNYHYDRIIALEYRDSSGYDIISSDALYWYKGAPTVALEMAMPIASGLSKEVYIIGCDGSPDGIMSNHAKGASIKEVHSKTVIAKEDVYVKYNTVQKEWETYLSRGEHDGITYTCLTPSWIPALKNRFGDFKKV